jgi:hypothetical protein
MFQTRTSERQNSEEAQKKIYINKDERERERERERGCFG